MKKIPIIQIVDSQGGETTRDCKSQGGRAAHARGNAHEFTSEEAREAGSRSHINDRGHSRDDEDDDDDRRGRSSNGGRRSPPRDNRGRFTSR